MLTAPKIEKAIPEATSDGDWNKSTDAGTPGYAWNPSSANAGTSDEPLPSDIDELIKRKCKKCGSMGHYADACSKAAEGKREPLTCFNRYEVGHRKADCPNEKVFKCNNCDEIGHHRKDCPKPRDWSRVQCNRCQQFGHTYVKCSQPALSLSQGPNVGFDNVEETNVASSVPSGF